MKAIAHDKSVPSPSAGLPLPGIGATPFSVWPWLQRTFCGAVRACALPALPDFSAWFSGSEGGLPYPAKLRSSVAILISLSSLCAFYALLALRRFDDNRLTSWQWVFADTQVVTTGLILMAGLASAWLVSGVRISARHAALLLFFLSFAAGTLLWREPEVIVDSARYFSQAKYLEIYGIVPFLREWGHGIRAWTDLPLVPFLYGLTFKFCGENRQAIQFLTTFFFSGTVILTYLIGRTLWDDVVGLYGGALLLGMPYLLTQVPLMLVDVPAMFFLTLALFVTLKALGQDGLPLLLLAAAAIALALLAKYSTWLMLSVLPVAVLAYRRQQGWGVRVRRAAVVALGVTLLMGMLLLWKSDVVTQQLHLLTAYQLPGLGRWHESHLSTFLFQIHPFLTIAAACSVFVAWRKRDARYLIIGWMVLLIVLLEIKRIRYALIAFPMLALMAAYGLRQIGDTRIRNYMVLSIVASSLVITVAGYSAFLQKTSAGNLKHAGEYLNTMKASTVEVIALPQARSSVNPALSVPLLDLFTHKKLTYRHDPMLIPVPPPGALAVSPLRFSWEYAPAPYYAPAKTEASTVIAVISSSDAQAFPPRLLERLAGFRLVRRFAQQEGVFRYTPVVALYAPVSS